jgi:hypothetical protein
VCSGNVGGQTAQNVRLKEVSERVGEGVAASHFVRCDVSVPAMRVGRLTAAISAC